MGRVVEVIRKTKEPLFASLTSAENLTFVRYKPRQEASGPFRVTLCLSWLAHAGWSRPRSDKKVTWLILPVVICLSQRLSHACLSVNNVMKLRMAH